MISVSISDISCGTESEIYCSLMLISTNTSHMIIQGTIFILHDQDNYLSIGVSLELGPI